MAKILICESDLGQLKEFSRAAVAMDHHLDFCQNTGEVIERGAKSPLDILVIAVDQTLSNTLAVLRTIQDYSRSIQFILTFDHPADLISLASHSGVVALLPRPVSSIEFDYAVQRALSKPSPEFR